MNEDTFMISDAIDTFYVDFRTAGLRFNDFFLVGRWSGR